MSTHAPAGADIPRFSEQEPIARDVKTSRFTPDTQAEYRDLVWAFARMQKWCLYLRALKETYKETPERYRDEYQGIPGVWPLELDDAIREAEERRDEMDAGLDEWERFS